MTDRAEIDRSFHVAVFTPMGRLEGTGIRRTSDLSPKWLEVCRVMLSGCVGSSAASVPFENLQHLSLRFTRAEGAMLATFAAHGQLAVSCLVLDGSAPAIENEVVDLFVASVKRAVILQQEGELPFAALRTLSARPLQVLVVWDNPSVSEADHGLLQDLTAHFGGAVLG